MPKTAWTKLESWEPSNALSTQAFCVYNRQKRQALWWPDAFPKFYKSRAAALRAANKQNRLEGLPEVQ